jgi:hypothetical protein
MHLIFVIVALFSTHSSNFFNNPFNTDMTVVAGTSSLEANRITE